MCYLKIKSFYIVVFLFFVTLAKPCLAKELSLYTAQPLSDIKETISKFEQKFPEIKINVYRSGTSEILLKLQTEQKVGIPSADIVLLSDDVSMEYLKSRKMLAYMDFDNWKLLSKQKHICDKEQYYCSTKIISVGIVYNKNLQVFPRSWKELTDPKYYGQLVIADPSYSGAAALQASIFLHSSDKNLNNFYKDIAKQKVTIVSSNGHVLEYLTKGLKNLGVIVDYMAARAIKNGSNLGFYHPDDGAVIITEPVAILASSQNHEAAMHFVEFLLSNEGQEVLKNQGYESITEQDKLPYKGLSYDPKKLLESYENDKNTFKAIFKD